MGIFVNRTFWFRRVVVPDGISNDLHHGGGILGNRVVPNVLSPLILEANPDEIVTL